MALMIGSKSGRSSRAVKLGSVIPIPAIIFFLRMIRTADRARRWEALTCLVVRLMCAG